MQIPFSERARAGFVLFCLLTAIAYGWLVYHPTPRNSKIDDASNTDERCYEAIVQRINAGETYYAAAACELRSRGYPTSSVFNWRLPLLAYLLGILPSVFTARIIGILISAALLCIWVKAFIKERFAYWQILIGGILLFVSVIVYSFTDAIYYHEFSSGVLIAISLGLYAGGYRISSAIAGSIALVIRELSLPFNIMMLAFAYFEGKRKEAFVWACGLSVFILEFAFHWVTVMDLVTAADKKMNGGWIVLGGWPFVLDGASSNLFLILGPAWLAATLVPLAMIGHLQSKSPGMRRTMFTVFLYMMIFAIIGKPSNWYWGFMYSTLLPIGFIQIPSVFRYFWKALRGHNHCC